MSNFAYDGVVLEQTIVSPPKSNPTSILQGGEMPPLKNYCDIQKEKVDADKMVSSDLLYNTIYDQESLWNDFQTLRDPTPPRKTLAPAIKKMKVVLMYVYMVEPGIKMIIFGFCTF